MGSPSKGMTGALRNADNVIDIGDIMIAGMRYMYHWFKTCFLLVRKL
jgi:hypothetical protein